MVPIALSIAGDTEQALWFHNAPPEVEGDMEDQQPVEESAEDCKNMHQLKAWYAARKAVLDKYVPKPYERFSLDLLRQEYDMNAHRLQKGQPMTESRPNKPSSSEAPKDEKHLAESTTATTTSTTTTTTTAGFWSSPLLLIGTQVVPAAAEECTNKSQLDAWYAAQKAHMKKYVPGGYANFPLNAMKKDYEQNLQRLKHEATKAESFERQPSAQSQVLALTAEPESIGSLLVVSFGVGGALLISLSAFLACRMLTPPPAPPDYVQLPPSEA